MSQHDQIPRRHFAVTNGASGEAASAWAQCRGRTFGDRSDDATLSTLARPPRRLYGDELAATFGAEGPAPSIVTRSLPRTELAVTELRVDNPVGRISDPLPPDNAYLISHELRTYRGMEYWEKGRHLTTYDLRAGETTITDLRREPQVKFEVPVHCMLWLVPHAALDAIADDANVPRIEGLPHAPGVGFADETIRHLNLAVLAALQRPGQVSRLFVDHLTLAFAAHVAQRYGGMESAARLIKGGLAPWQERRAKEMLVADLTAPRLSPISQRLAVYRRAISPGVSQIDGSYSPCVVAEGSGRTRHDPAAPARSIAL